MRTAYHLTIARHHGADDAAGDGPDVGLNFAPSYPCAGSSSRCVFTEREWETLQKGVTGAGMLVALSDRGFLHTFKEAGALAKHVGSARKNTTSELVRELADTRGTGFGITPRRQTSRPSRRKPYARRRPRSGQRPRTSSTPIARSCSKWRSRSARRPAVVRRQRPGRSRRFARRSAGRRRLGRPRVGRHNAYSPDVAARGRKNGSTNRRSVIEAEEAAFAASSLVELAGLEPATSWVQFRRQLSPVVVILRVCSHSGGSRVFASPPFAALRRGYLTKT